MLKRLIAAALAITIASPTMLQAQASSHREKDRQRSEKKDESSAKQKPDKQKSPRTVQPVAPGNANQQGQQDRSRQRPATVERQSSQPQPQRVRDRRTVQQPTYQRQPTGRGAVQVQQNNRRRFNDWRDDSRYRQSLQDRRTWSNNWRNDRRYDWRSYRNSNRHIYRLHRYVAPRGYRYHYRRHGIGALLQAIFFSPTYWITNPYYYRLPPAYGRYRWVRYYDDALLVDIYTGRIVDVAYGIFWY